ncbi:MAG TPA: hypothetical protein VH040_07180 [Usitatibacter sp.]|jgi:hypothetical protein|nr:hypothetical protein [Usitatibacter sp.]
MHEERFHFRDRTYSAWHRRLSTRRFVGIERAQLLSMIDLDAALFVEFDNRRREPLALIETARDVGQTHKCAAITTRLAERANLPCFVLLYTIADVPNPADSTACDISSFRVRRLWPKPERGWRRVTPVEWANALVRIRGWAARRLDLEAANDPQWGESTSDGEVTNE